MHDKGDAYIHRRRLLDDFFNGLINVISSAFARLRKHASHRGIDDKTRVTLVTTARYLHSRVCSITNIPPTRERAKLISCRWRTYPST